MAKFKHTTIEHQAEIFYNQYESVLIAAEQYLIEKLSEICSQYCRDHNLPPRAISVQSRRKSISSFIKKLKRKQVLKISLNYEDLTDIVGARIICWFVDDCSGILETLLHTELLSFLPDSIENFIENPKETGYRSIHILNELEVEKLGPDIELNETFNKIISEIQIRTKIQDSWAEITHEFHYKAKYAGVENPTYESLLGDISERLALEDKTMMKFRDAYGKLADRNNKMIQLSHLENTNLSDEKVVNTDSKSTIVSQNNVYEITGEVQRERDIQYLSNRTSKTS